MSMTRRFVLAINPGSTSTKFALYKESDLVFEKNLAHSFEDIAAFKEITDQLDFRKELILKELRDHEADLSAISAIVG
ncbi:MAG: butyrate kinase, partial [Bacteroidetes bacterium]|nr:butyrate kinase [Bacteroidota bacterium]